MAPLGLFLALLVPLDTIPEPSLAARLGAGVTVGTGLEVPFTPSDPSSFGGGRTGPAGTNAVLRLTVAGHLFNRLTASVTFNRYLVPRLQAPWDPDFVYAIGYDASWPHGFAIGYANYDANRLSPGAGQALTRVERGVVTAAYSPPIPAWARHPGRPIEVVHPRIAYDLVPSYYHNDTGLYQQGKHRLGAGAVVVAYRFLFAQVVAFGYPDGDRQQPWDPDYSYAFGYARGWPNQFRVQYANYSGTRYPWRTGVEGTGAFRHGSVSVSYSHRF